MLVVAKIAKQSRGSISFFLLPMSRGGLRLYVQDGSFSGFCPQAVTVARQRPIFTALSGDQPIKGTLYM